MPGLQFVLTSKQAHWLDSDFIVFGKVTQGAGIIESTTRDYGSYVGRPKADFVISDCGVFEFPPKVPAGREADRQGSV